MQRGPKRNVSEGAKERRSGKERERKAKGSRVIGVYFVGSQNSPTAASSSLGNFLNSRGDPSARDVLCQFIFSPRNNRAKRTRVSRSGRIRRVLSFFPPPPLSPPSAFFLQFIPRCLSARLDLSTYKWRSFVRLC